MRNTTDYWLLVLPSEYSFEKGKAQCMISSTKLDIKMKPKKTCSKAKSALGRVCSERQIKRPEKTNQPTTEAMTQTQRQITPKGLGFVCFGCKKPIKRDKFLLKACDKFWHENCLKCDRCHRRLGELGSTLFCKANMNLCRRDYLEIYGKTGVCSACDKLIGSSEMVMRAKHNVYHLECFACQLCSQRFCVGDRFYLCENKVVCQYDYEENILPIQRSLIEPSENVLYRTILDDNKRDSSIISAIPDLGPRMDSGMLDLDQKGKAYNCTTEKPDLI